MAAWASAWVTQPRLAISPRIMFLRRMAAAFCRIGW